MMMRENMSNGLGWVNRGPRKMSYFDRTYKPGRFPVDVRNIGTIIDSEGETQFRGPKAQPVMGFNRPARDEPYLVALRDFFEDRIDKMEPRPRQDLSNPKQHLHDIMHDGRSTRDLALERGVSQPSVVQGRKDALEQLLGNGGKDALAKELHWFLATRGIADMLPGWVHG